MLLLQISDIHFRTPHCLTPDMDPDRGLRTRMTRHLLARVAALGRVDAILVSGDIAFKADPAEYAVAKAWLLELAQKCGCSEDRIFVIPGNHDVDRTAIAARAATREVQQSIAEATDDARASKLRAKLADAVTGHDLFHGHAAYNDFAAPMNCQIYPERSFWKQDVELAIGVQLRIHGLTSTLLSGQNGGNDVRGSLYLSPLQTALDPVPDVVNMIMCHHPCDWLSDGDDAEDLFNGRATLQLFGHKHRQRVHMEADLVRWGAGAVNPSPDEKKYEPGYNLVRLDIVGEGRGRGLRVQTHQFAYQSNPEGFRPIRTTQETDVFETVIPFPVDVVPSFNAAATPPDLVGMMPANPLDDDPIPSQPAADAEAAMGDAGTRNIIARFWDLPGSARRELALDLGLITTDEIALAEPERYGKALIRAKERGLVEELANKIAEREAR